MGEHSSTSSAEASQLSRMGSHREVLLFKKPAQKRIASLAACTPEEWDKIVLITD